MENQVSFDGLDFSPEINLSRYLQNIKQFPILSQEEEYNLAKEYVRTRDAKISYRLVTSHLRLVVKVVSKFRGYDFGRQGDRCFAKSRFRQTRRRLFHRTDQRLGRHSPPRRMRSAAAE